MGPAPDGSTSNKASPLSALVQPRSIAVLGASDRASIGRSLIQSLARFGYPGTVYPVNPRHREILGLACYPSVRDLPSAPDVVAFCIGGALVLETLPLLAERGVGAAVIYDGGFAERGDDGRKRQEAIAGLCREAGIALCGPNCMGVLNPVARSTTYLAALRDPAGLAGNVGLVSQSGSICNGMLADLRRFGFSLVVSTGNEAVISTAAYIEHLIDDPDTKVIATFTETVREPERYVAALDRAAAKGKPVVVLKVGRSDRSRRAIHSHTGGLAGETRVFSELLRAHRAIEVSDLDELAEVLAVCQGTRWPRGRRIGLTTGSGGQVELILDIAAPIGLDLPPLSAVDRAEAERVIGPITGDGNPLDYWGNGKFHTNLPHALATLGAGDAHDAVVYCLDTHDDQPMAQPERLIEYAEILVQAATRSDKPHYLMNMRPGVMHRGQVALLARHGIPVIGGTRQGLRAIDRVGRSAVPLPPLRPVSERPASLVAGRGVINEFEAKRLLGAHGLPVAREHLVGSVAEAERAAAAVGYPVVLKAVSDGIPHKSELGLVALDLGTAEALRRSWDQLNQRLDAAGLRSGLAGFLVQEFVARGIEVFAGVTRDPDFGLSLAFGTGGVGIEVTHDFALRLLPLREGDTEAMIAETRVSALLGAYRGQPAADRTSLVGCLEALADFAGVEADRVAEIDLNPIKVLPAGQGCRIVDALIVTTPAGRETML
jgi:acyl-CoA synthetase (NDP forming)